MVLVPPERRIIQLPGSQFRSAVSEDLVQRQGATSNQIAFYQYDVLDYKLNGPYGNVADLPTYGLDGLYVFPFKMQIINIAMYNDVVGTSGTTELDVKVATASGGAFTSIFTTTPKINSTASAFAYALSYNITLGATDQIFTPNATPPTGVTPAMFSGGAPFIVNPGTAIRIDLLNKMADAEDAGLIVYFRPATQ